MAITKTRSRLYTISLGDSAEATVHVWRWRDSSGKRQVSAGMSANSLPWHGHCELSMSVTTDAAINQLHDWHTRGYAVRIFRLG